MTPIEISSSVSTLSTQDLQNKLHRLLFTFIQNSDFTSAGGIAGLVEDLEVYTLEALLRVFEAQLGYVPYQNKIYEKTEGYFGNQDAYNINRMMSSLRRAKAAGFNTEDEKFPKYIHWMSNRVKYGIKTLIAELGEIGDVARSDSDNVRQPATA